MPLAGFEMLEQMPKLTVAGMRGVSIVHKFSSGWFKGTWKKTKMKNGLWKVYYPDAEGSRTGKDWEQSLLAESYGAEKWWVAIKRSSAPRKSAKRKAESDAEGSFSTPSS